MTDEEMNERINDIVTDCCEIFENDKENGIEGNVTAVVNAIYRLVGTAAAGVYRSEGFEKVVSMMTILSKKCMDGVEAAQQDEEECAECGESIDE